MATVTCLEPGRLGVVVSEAPLAEAAKVTVRNILAYEQTGTCLAIDVQQSKLTVDQAAWLIIEIYHEFNRERTSPAHLLPSIVLIADSFSDEEYKWLSGIGAIPLDRSKPWNSNCQTAADLRDSLAKMSTSAAVSAPLPTALEYPNAGRPLLDPDFKSYLNSLPPGVTNDRLDDYFRRLNSL